MTTTRHTTQTSERVAKAAQTADLLLADLIDANKGAAPVMHLHIMRLTGLAATLRNDLAALDDAMQAPL